jgi:hypothetical protein
LQGFKPEAWQLRAGTSSTHRRFRKPEPRERQEIAMENLWLLVVAGGPAIILVAVVLVLMQRRRRHQPDVRSPDYEVGGNKYVRDPADKTRRT